MKRLAKSFEFQAKKISAKKKITSEKVDKSSINLALRDVISPSASNETRLISQSERSYYLNYFIISIPTASRRLCVEFTLILTSTNEGIPNEVWITKRFIGGTRTGRTWILSYIITNNNQYRK